MPVFWLTADTLHYLETFPDTAAYRASLATYDWAHSDSFWVAVALEGETPVGYAVAARLPKLDARGGFVFVDELYVRPEFRRRGVARALLAHIEALAAALGYVGVRLLARADNTPAQALYRQAGFAESVSLFFEKQIPR